MNRRQQISKAPKFLVYIDTSSLETYTPKDGMIKREVGCGMSPIYYVELQASDILGAISEAQQYKEEGVYLIDILQKLSECDEWGYVKYAPILRCCSHGFYDIKEEGKSEWIRGYNPEHRWVD